MAAGIVIIGGGMAAARACVSLRASDYRGPVTLISEEAVLPYDRPPLSKASVTDSGDPDPIWLIQPDTLASLNIDARLGLAADRIDRAAKQVLLSDGTSIPYDKLLIATGAKPRSLGPHAVILRDHGHALDLRRRFLPEKSIVIIGGGFIGLELASSAAKLGCKVTLIEAQPRILMRGVPEAIARIVHDRHLAAGIKLLIGTAIAEIGENSVVLKDGRVIEADTIIAGIGAAPEVRLAQEAGLEIENGIACNSEMQTSDSDIYAAGDCCSFIHTGFGARRVRLEAWRNAQDQADTAVANMLGERKPHAAIPWFWSDQHDLSLQIAGMPDMGPHVVERRPAESSLILFHLADDGTLMGVSGIGVGNAIARDIKLSEMMIAKGMKPSPDALANPAVQIKSLLKG
ncbi:NAD(P)/FAD-dependent oxidoreductase [Aestuariivirga litoralis]|uniref:NAD(P)/FAD-dependent oxidoreductase n=1 Tax=Aestuariivirga litoralis TaxID=2650924 RepID=UPI0018C600AA|nr:FAD-dependent oxidoreductase [Aestuariivirga litoralis]MBG1233507.1 ferredoxin reductase [Aestuariivirga litoralis]